MKLATIGSNCIDYYSLLNTHKAYPGGGPVNMAVYAKRLGQDSSYIGVIGDDKNGELLRSSIAKQGVDISHLHTLKGSTAVTQVTLKNGERIFGDYNEGVLAQYKLNDDDINFICEHDVVVCDLWGKVEDQIEDLHNRDIITAFDCATEPYEKACQIAIPHTDILFFSTDEYDENYLSKQIKELNNRGPKLVIVMLGEKGSLCYDGKQIHKCGIVKCDNVVDTMGAGDSYIAGFLCSYINGADIDTAMQAGAATASDTLKYFGAW